MNYDFTIIKIKTDLPIASIERVVKFMIKRRMSTVHATHMYEQ